MTAGRRLWIIDPSMSFPEDEGVAEILHGWTGEHRLFRPALIPGDGPGPLTDHATDAVVVMGSRASVDDPLPWIERLATWLRPIVEGARVIPVLGICFGHQLIAHLAGGEVGLVAADGSKRTGVETTRIRNSGLVAGDATLRVVVSHREEVKACPPGFRVVASRPGVPVDGLEHTSLPLYSFQFHPEAREEFARHAGIAPEGIDETLRSENRRLLHAFHEVVVTRGASLGRR